MALDEWLVPVLVVATVVAIISISARPGRRKSDRPPDPASGPELIQRLERDLGIAVLVDSIEGDGPVSINASMMSGRHRTEMTATGDTEDRAWRELARQVIAWHNADPMKVPMWPGGG